MYEQLIKIQNRASFAYTYHSGIIILVFLFLLFYLKRFDFLFNLLHFYTFVSYCQLVFRPDKVLNMR